MGAGGGGGARWTDGTLPRWVTALGSTWYGYRTHTTCTHTLVCTHTDTHSCALVRKYRDFHTWFSVNRRFAGTDAVEMACMLINTWRGEQRGRKQGDSLRDYSLGRFMVARTGHVGNVGGDGLDLPHELIADPRIVLRNNAYLASWHQIMYTTWQNDIKPTAIIYNVFLRGSNMSHFPLVNGEKWQLKTTFTFL